MLKREQENTFTGREVHLEIVLGLIDRIKLEKMLLEKSGDYFPQRRNVGNLEPVAAGNQVQNLVKNGDPVEPLLTKGVSEPLKDGGVLV